jgi:hypothetical protein
VAGDDPLALPAVRGQSDGWEYGMTDARYLARLGRAE